VEVESPSCSTPSSATSSSGIVGGKQAIIGQTALPHPTQMNQMVQDSTATYPIDQEHCPICGDRVSGYHYGLLTCEC
jgi:hypothetical protein